MNYLKENLYFKSALNSKMFKNSPEKEVGYLTDEKMIIKD